jgi:hypothetical protein
MTADVLSARALGRATLARQMLLERQGVDVMTAVARLVGLQAQEPVDPYHALWSRLAGFDPDVLSGLIVDRALVRIVVMRGTIHLLTADDALRIRPVMQPVLEAELARHSEHGPHLRGIDASEIVAYVRALVEEQPRTGKELRAAIAAAFPDLDAAALTYACRNRLPMVQVPPRGEWRRSGQVRTTTLDSWVGRPLTSTPSIDDIVLRYFGAFGPATVADVSAWCRLTGMREVVDRVRARLRPFRDERGRELFDLPDAPRPDADTPAPVRLLPQYDNVLLSHADRSRFARDDAAALAGASTVRGTVLHDGRVAGTWYGTGDRASGVHTMTVEHLAIPKRACSAIAAEARRFATFSRPDAAGIEVKLVALPAVRQ